MSIEDLEQATEYMRQASQNMKAAVRNMWISVVFLSLTLLLTIVRMFFLKH